MIHFNASPLIRVLSKPYIDHEEAGGGRRVELAEAAKNAFWLTSLVKGLREGCISNQYSVGFSPTSDR
jgi:hypothetical protein